MYQPKLQPVETAENLRQRVGRLFKEPLKLEKSNDQLSLGLSFIEKNENKVEYPSQSIGKFLDFISDAMPSGDVYLFGGVLRDLALFGRNGFNSDIDLVIEGNWSHFVTYLHSLKAQKNKFGGYRLMVGGWPVDIWNAEDTWAIKQGLVSYNGISSLTETTVLNWDAILMNWRTQQFIHKENYFEEIKLRALDIVLEENPNPLGMTVRVFRHLCSKEARKLTPSAAKYMASCANLFSFEEIRGAELRSYKNNVIQPVLYRFFAEIDALENKSIEHRYSIARNIVERELGLR